MTNVQPRAQSKTSQKLKYVANTKSIGSAAANYCGLFIWICPKSAQLNRNNPFIYWLIPVNQNLFDSITAYKKGQVSSVHFIPFFVSLCLRQRHQR